jgi:ATP-binding cassette, subfamily C, bacteriocin exporter
LVSQIFTLIVLWAGARDFVMSNSITPGELLSFYAVIGYFTAPVSDITGLNRSLQDALIADRLFEIFDLYNEGKNGLITLNAEMAGEKTFQEVKLMQNIREVVGDNNNGLNKGGITTSFYSQLITKHDF